MEGQHSPETDLTRCHQVLEGDTFYSSILRLATCCFLALLRVHTHTCELFGITWGCLRSDLPSRKRRQFVSEQQPHCRDVVYQGQEEWYDNWRRNGMDLCIRESRFLWKNSQAELVSGAADIGDQSWIGTVAFSPCQSAWENCQTRRRWGGSLKIAGEMLTLTSTWSCEPIGAEEEQETWL